MKGDPTGGEWVRLDESPSASAQMIVWYAPETAKALQDYAQAVPRRAFRDRPGLWTEKEQAEWDVDPDSWPHTPPLHIFRALMEDDSNIWWRAGIGHGLNAYEAAIERVEVLEDRLEELDAQLVFERFALAEMFGWFPFGTHVDQDVALEFAGTDESGLPRWERPNPYAALRADDVE